MNKLLVISLFCNVVFVAFFMMLVHSLGGISYLLFKVRGGAGITGLYEHRKNLFEMLPKPKGEIIFLGDSITAECEWSELLGREDVKNRGIGGDFASGLLKRLNPIIEAQPDKLFLMVGVNDLIYGSESDLVKNYEKLLKELADKLPDSQIIVQSILPVNSQVRRMPIDNETILQINEKIKNLTDKFGLVYADLNSLMTDEDGQLKADYTRDGIHINGKAYQIWKAAIEVYLNAAEEE